jgi:hypothetical protein
MSPGTPFGKTLVLAEESRADTQSRQREGNLICCNSSRRKAHATKLKARAMSIFRRTLGFFLACNILAESCTSLKLSWINLPLMKAL